MTTETMSIIILVAVALLIISFGYQIITAFKKHYPIGWTTYILLAIAILFAILVVYQGHELKVVDWAEILLTLGLITITATYALSTEKMAKEMREQRLSEARPYLLLRLEGEAVQWDKDEKGKPPDRNFPVTIRNVGKGPATNLWAALWGPKKTYFGDSKGYLAPGEEWQTTIHRASTDMVELGIEKEGWLPELRKSIKKEYAGVVVVKYNDIHNRAWGSYLCLERHVDVEYFVIEEKQNIVELKNGD
jgi:hypothetical protein